MTVHAPFRFAPVAEQVYFPAWGPLATHDIPFKDGLCGEFALEIEAKTPLLVAGARRKATKGNEEEGVHAREGEARAFQLPDKTYAIPASSLQGMVRSVLEIASCAKLGAFVDERRFGIRDLDEAAAPFYRQRLVNHWQTGFMTRSVIPNATEQAIEKWEIAPCTGKRIQFADIPLMDEANRYQLPKKSTSVERYALIQSAGPFAAHVKQKLDVTLQADPNGSAWLVVTGNTGVKKGKTQKAREFVFIDNGSGAKVCVSDDVRSDFRHIHENGEPNDSKNWATNWRAFWEEGYGDAGNREPFKDGGRIPVFYIVEHDKVASVGLASMFKLAHSHTTHQMLASSTSEHLRGAKSKSVKVVGEDQSDLPSLIFGSASDDYGKRGLRRRASFDIARAVGEKGSLPKSRDFDRAILLSPKPNYYPIYVVQPKGSKPDELPTWHKAVKGGARDALAPFATFTPLRGKIVPYQEQATRAHTLPKLAGVKIWPARGDGWRQAKLRPAHLENQRVLQTTLKTLDAGAKFKTALRFHNLRPVELGALLWTLTFAEPAAWSKDENIELRHRLGTGKPFGLGEIAIRIVDDLALRSNDLSNPKTWTIPDLIAEFEKEMTRFKSSWRQSHAILTLLAAADPRVGRRANVTIEKPDVSRTSRAFDYMELKIGDDGWNDFAVAKKAGKFLPPYVEAPVVKLEPGVRVRIGEGENYGTILAALPNDPRYRVQPDSGGQPQPYHANMLTPLA